MQIQTFSHDIREIEIPVFVEECLDLPTPKIPFPCSKKEKGGGDEESFGKPLAKALGRVRAGATVKGGFPRARRVPSGRVTFFYFFIFFLERINVRAGANGYGGFPWENIKKENMEKGEDGGGGRSNPFSFQFSLLFKIGLPHSNSPSYSIIFVFFNFVLNKW